MFRLQAMIICLFFLFKCCKFYCISSVRWRWSSYCTIFWS